MASAFQCFCKAGGHFSKKLVANMKLRGAVQFGRDHKHHALQVSVRGEVLDGSQKSQALWERSNAQLWWFKEIHINCGDDSWELQAL